MGVSWCKGELYYSFSLITIVELKSMQWYYYTIVCMSDDAHAIHVLCSVISLQGWRTESSCRPNITHVGAAHSKISKTSCFVIHNIGFLIKIAKEANLNVWIHAIMPSLVDVGCKSLSYVHHAPKSKWSKARFDFVEVNANPCMTADILGHSGNFPCEAGAVTKGWRAPSDCMQVINLPHFLILW